MSPTRSGTRGSSGIPFGVPGCRRGRTLDGPDWKSKKEEAFALRLEAIAMLEAIATHSGVFALCGFGVQLWWLKNAQMLKSCSSLSGQTESGKVAHVWGNKDASI